ncbi:hypothetical protein CAPTEDRAFT_206536 [Capitella teleta]|uniref:Uncharacterized protein n=1 Tax=Capitella teleta TaxID=283909 RepID=R7U9Y3_CAPTE|nr:hypothetical protein CAPTEDRAFT_206536 [Capitella teleta]|eukprot:ELT99930.1 hypothetical protein CAPTEDRAFT_206536 [Capitella teleta]
MAEKEAFVNNWNDICLQHQLNPQTDSLHQILSQLHHAHLTQTTSVSAHSRLFDSFTAEITDEPLAYLAKGSIKSSLSMKALSDFPCLSQFTSTCQNASHALVPPGKENHRLPLSGIPSQPATPAPRPPDHPTPAPRPPDNSLFTRNPLSLKRPLENEVSETEKSISVERSSLPYRMPSSETSGKKLSLNEQPQEIETRKKFGSNHSTATSAQGNPPVKKSLGTRRGLSGKFVSPLMSKESNDEP